MVDVRTQLEVNVSTGHVLTRIRLYMFWVLLWFHSSMLKRGYIEMAKWMLTSSKHVHMQGPCDRAAIVN
jgi:hypothetical protein